MAQRTLVVPSVQENNDAVEIKIPRPNRWVQNHLAEEQLNEFSSSQDVENINTTRMNKGWFEGEKEQNFESFSSDELTNRLILAQLEESNQEEEINSEKRHNKFINKNPQRKKELKIRKEKSVQILENSEVEIAKLKMMVWEDLIKNRTQTAPNIELHNAPRTTQDYITELIQKQVGNAAFNFVDLGVVVDKFLLWKRKLPRAEPFYAIKSNPDKEIANVLNILGAGFDCASKAEISQCLDMGVSPDRIIFANPCKAVDHLVYARETGVKMMTFDNMDELNKIQKHFPEAHLVLRLLPDDSYSLMPFGIKFGATMEDATKLMQACKERAMTLIGVSFHVGSGCLSSIAYVEAVKLARRAFDEAAKFGIEMTFLDLGGGWPGHENGDLKFGDIGTKITPVIDQLFPENVRVIGEPGRFICTETTTLACHIVGKRERTISGVAQEPEKETQYYINDGVYGSFNCIMFDHANPTPSFLGSNGERPLTKSTIFGPTCDSMDVICKKTYLPEHFVGEWIYFSNMGAYTSSAASSFNGFAPPRSVYIIEATSKSS